MTARGRPRNTNSSLISATGCTEFSPRSHPVQAFKRSDLFSSPFAVELVAAKGGAGQQGAQGSGLRRFGCNALVGFVALY